MKLNSPMLTRETFDQWRDDRTGKCLSGSNPQFSRRWIGEELNVSDTLSQFVKHRDTTSDKRAAIRRRLYASRAAIEQTNAERMFQLRDGPRQRWLGRPELFGRLAHAARLHHRDEDADVVQLETSLDAIGLVHSAGYPIANLLYHYRTIAFLRILAAPYRLVDRGQCSRQ